MQFNQNLLIIISITLINIGCKLSSVSKAETVESKTEYKCENDTIPLALKNEVDSWENFQFTNPSIHTDSDYSYLIHVIDSKVQDAKKYYWTKNGQHFENFVTNPEMFHKLPIISASLINNTKNIIYGNGTQFAVILKVHKDNIISTREVDMQSFSARKVFEGIEESEAYKIIYEKYRANFGILSPQHLLYCTPVKAYNEVLIRGTSLSGNRVEVIGYMVFIESSLGIVSPMIELDNLKKIANIKKLPVIIVKTGTFDMKELKAYKGF